MLHHLGAKNHHLGGRVFHLELSDDGGCVVGHEELLEVIDDHLANQGDVRKDRGGIFLQNAYLVHSVGAVGGLDRGGELAARPDVPDDGLLDAGEELRAVLQHGGETGRSRNVQRHLVCLWRIVRAMNKWKMIKILSFLSSRKADINKNFHAREKQGGERKLYNNVP